MKNTQTTTVVSGNTLRVILASALLAFSWLVAPAKVWAVPCQLTLNWSNTDSTVDGFKIERATSSLGPWTQVAQVVASPTSYQDIGVVANVVYFYRLRAYNAAGDSGYSNVASANTPCLGPADSVGDGIPDLWRQTYWGGSGTTTNNKTCATCDASGTGQNNQFKYVAGLDPTNPASVFVLRILSVAGQPSQKKLIFGPIRGGRTYTVESRANPVSGSYSALGSFSGPVTIANKVTVTDLNATQLSKFYRVHVSLP